MFHSTVVWKIVFIDRVQTRATGRVHPNALKDGVPLTPKLTRRTIIMLSNQQSYGQGVQRTISLCVIDCSPTVDTWNDGGEPFCFFRFLVMVELKTFSKN